MSHKTGIHRNQTNESGIDSDNMLNSRFVKKNTHVHELLDLYNSYKNDDRSFC